MAGKALICGTSIYQNPKWRGGNGPCDGKDDCKAAIRKEIVPIMSNGHRERSVSMQSRRDSLGAAAMAMSIE